MGRLGLGRKSNSEGQGNYWMTRVRVVRKRTMAGKRRESEGPLVMQGRR